MARQIALLRGVNVGAKKVAMAKLREIFAELGFTDVKTYVNSGNVVFSGRKASVKKIEAAIAAEFGFDVPVVIRTRDELAAVAEANPLAQVATNASRYLVLFSGGGAIDAAKAEGVTVGKGEAYEIVGREAYLWLPDGIHASPLVKGLTEKRLGVAPLTGRNWRTVEKLLALADADGS
ncbi:hypothetical protein DSM104299_03459 [Baekduia alba]|uniref:DUF1697 domain-containing protein n=1 Tax=Baekduia alba TaxID=2997333 RepID=UPI002340D381|nr:DUF1697 domain-containing protein [Baekduia alba]WCB94720.1 hypothetical protein DSM104299_03459 [Baekduia alba]